MRNLYAKVTLLAGLGALALLPGARADEWSQRTVFTFSEPIEIPGQVLPAGTYVFKLANSSSNRHIVQVYNQDENHIFGMFLAIPDYRLHPAEKTIVKFAERPAGSPQALKAWFFPGKNFGHEFVYPKTEALALAQANNTPVPSMPAGLAPETMKQAVTLTERQVIVLNAAPLKAEEPNGEEVELAEAFPPAETQASAPSAAELQQQMPEKLPQTATPLPLIGLLGLLSLGTAATLRLAFKAR